MTNDNNKNLDDDNIREMAYTPPTIQTADPSNVSTTSTSMEIGGGITDMGDATWAGGDVVYRLKGTSTWTHEIAMDDVTPYDTWWKNITGLQSGETYEYAGASEWKDPDGNWHEFNDGEHAMGPINEITLDSADVDPSIGTPPAINVEDDSVTLVGYLDDLGTYDSIYVRFYLNEINATWDYYTDYFQMSSAPDIHTVNISGLNISTNYEYNFRAYDSNYNHLVTAPTETFTTKSEILVVQATTQSATSVTDSSAILNGSIEDMGGYTELAFRYYVKDVDNNILYFTDIYGPISSTGDLPGVEVKLNSDTNYEYELRILESV